MPNFRQIRIEQTEQHVGRVLRIRRRELDMSQKVLAERMGTSQEVISNYENGVTPVRADDLPRLAQILDVLPTYFLQTGVGVEHLVLSLTETGDFGQFSSEGEDTEYLIPEYDALVLYTPTEPAIAEIRRNAEGLVWLRLSDETRMEPLCSFLDFLAQVRIISASLQMSEAQTQHLVAWTRQRLG